MRRFVVLIVTAVAMISCSPDDEVTDLSTTDARPISYDSC